MGSDLRLTGLASGMDWQPIVEKLLELEAIPKKRLESQKAENKAKVSDLGVLKSQLDTLKSAASALQDESLFNARSVRIKNTNSGFAATASSGSITGEFTIEVQSLATATEISSKNRTSHRLANTIDLNDKLSELPLHAPITPGTFTISGKTYNISSTDISLQELVFLFTNSTSNGLFNMEDTVRDGMHRFMQEFSQTHAVDVDRLHICISTNIDAVRIRSYDGTKAIQDIPLKVLIKHFMK